jgi:chitinase
MSLCRTAVLGMTLALCAAAQAAPRFVAGPYKHTAMYRQSTHVITIAPAGVPIPAVAFGKRAFGPGTMSWAFATGECGEEHWGEESGQEIADANVAAFVKAGVPYIVSTGGQGGLFTCASDAGMERFIKRYQSAQLVGVDFDIEDAQTEAQIESLVERAVHAQKTWPALRFSFTVATHAASDGSKKCLNAKGEAILAAARKSGLRDYTFNLMVMDYGPPKPENCVVRDGVCEMGLSALQAVRNVHQKHGIPMNQIELTAMIGVNDVAANDFTVRDARVLAKAVKLLNLAGLHFWSIDRDRPCPEPTKGASATCSNIDAKVGEFSRIMSSISK